jgi:hypothetical protein
MNNSDDMRDPLRAVFDDHQRAPRDVVPHAEHSLDDLRRMADGTALVTVTHYELDERGVTRHSERVTITAPITNSGKENR